MLATSTPEVVNPVSDACEAAGVPCISTVVPWEAWYFGRGAKPGKPSPFRFTYHFCFGVAELLRHLHAPVAAGEDEQERRRDVAERRRRQRDPRRASGRCSRRPATRSSTRAPTRTGTNDYSAQIAKFKRGNCQIFNTFPIPPDFATFWRQAAQQG